MSNIIVYSNGICACSVCALNNLSVDEITDLVNIDNPSGTKEGWKISDDKTFATGQPNPCPCDQFPDSRSHYLFNC